VAHSLIEGLDLLGLQVADDGVDGGQQFVNEGHHLTNLTHRTSVIQKAVQADWNQISP
jgi:hypothetical protein